MRVGTSHESNRRTWYPVASYVVLSFVCDVVKFVPVVAVCPVHVFVPFRSCALLRLWHDVHKLCRLSMSVNAPPCVTGSMWSTTLAAYPHFTHTGLCFRYALRNVLHHVVQYRLSCLRLANGFANDFECKAFLRFRFTCATAV